MGVDNKTGWFVSSGLAASAGAAFLIRDGQMPGKQITILEQQLFSERAQKEIVKLFLATRAERENKRINEDQYESLVLPLVKWLTDRDVVEAASMAAHCGKGPPRSDARLCSARTFP